MVFSRNGDERIRAGYISIAGIACLGSVLVVNKLELALRCASVCHCNGLTVSSCTHPYLATCFGPRSCFRHCAKCLSGGRSTITVAPCYAYKILTGIDRGDPNT